ncbi:putative inner membrane protein [Yersinia pseudotuberculosis]|nr:putative inner membrane protein [Yersinia pseudotuberculosis]CNI60515.1 putative inner membrane protein [Yersinia pseudotuberculosis]CNJ51574.1 putative inner membrane protein [Yersinia pseudotuberculosis]VEE69827.1 putative inner membrane protein [Yersinia pseudotuberculosis]
MDIGLSLQERNNKYFYAMAKIEADKLINLSRRVSFNNIKDVFLRVKFENDIKEFTQKNLTFIRNARTDNDCKEGIDNLKMECYHLSKQDSMLSLKQAKVYISAKIEEHDKVIGYVIDGIAVIIGGLQMVAGSGILLGSIASGNIVGIIVGAHLILNGASSLSEGVKRQ